MRENSLCYGYSDSPRANANSSTDLQGAVVPFLVLLELRHKAAQNQLTRRKWIPRCPLSIAHFLLPQLLHRLSFTVSTCSSSLFPMPPHSALPSPSPPLSS
ncbi:hypothetical protein GN956_G12443 [Arapaima gigas]